MGGEMCGRNVWMRECGEGNVDGEVCELGKRCGWGRGVWVGDEGVGDDDSGVWWGGEDGGWGLQGEDEGERGRGGGPRKDEGEGACRGVCGGNVCEGVCGFSSFVALQRRTKSGIGHENSTSEARLAREKGQPTSGEVIEEEDVVAIIPNLIGFLFIGCSTQEEEEVGNQAQTLHGQNTAGKGERQADPRRGGGGRGGL